MTVNAFQVYFGLDVHFKSYIDDWINFALQKRVRQLEVNLQRPRVNWNDCYPFPVELFHRNPNTGYLTTLHLNYVDVTGQNLEYLLGN